VRALPRRSSDGNDDATDEHDHNHAIRAGGIRPGAGGPILFPVPTRLLIRRDGLNWPGVSKLAAIGLDTPPRPIVVAH